MKYRHDFHAGNFADVHKHVVLLALLRALQRKSKGFLYLDTHAGSGRYDLTSAAAHHGAEAAHGIHLLARTTPRTEALRHYLDTIAGWRQRCGNPRAYPGSPLLAAAQLRAQDRGICCELQHSAFRMLERTLADQPQLRAECADGYVQLRALLPAVERRALALIDPPYEDSAQEFNHAADAIDAALRRQANAVIALWYPIKDQRSLAPWLQRMGRLATPTLQAELWLHPRDSQVALNGSGMLIVNPPFEFDRDMSDWLPELATLLGADTQGGSSQQWLVHE